MRWIWALILLAIFSAEEARADAIVVRRCDEAALADALARADDGDMLTFACDGVIAITSTLVLAIDLTLSAEGQQVVLDGGDRVRVIYIEPEATVTISGITIQRGSAESGGSAINNTGTLHLSNSVLQDNVHALANFGEMTVDLTVFADNDGVGIYNSGELVVTGSTFTGNRHGIDNASGELVVANSTFYDNATHDPNGIGAGIANSGSVLVVNGTFVENHAPAGGSAVGTHLGGTVTLVNTLLVGDADESPCFGLITDGGHNLQYPGASCGDSVSTADPRLEERSEGADAFSFFLPGANSPAIGVADVDVCMEALVGNRDQRGQARTGAADMACDIGAVEAAPAS